MRGVEDLVGRWRSRYEYYSSSRREQLASEQELIAYADKQQLVFETPPGCSSYIFIRLSLDGKTATGTWYETTDPNGYYKGATYHGALQLIFNEKQYKFKGKWIGFGKNFDIKDGPWELQKIN